jgi:methyl-accepting chemotaxis protein
MNIGESLNQSNGSEKKGLAPVNQMLSIFESQLAMALDFNGNIKDISEPYVRFLGYASKDDLVGKNIRLLIEDSEEAKAIQQENWRNLLSEKTVTGIFKRLDAKGSPMWVKGNIIPVKGSTSAENRIFEYVIDINDEKALEEQAKTQLEEIKAQEEELRQNMEEISAQQEASERERKKNKATLDGCVDAVITIDVYNTVQYWNPAAEALTGYSAEEMLGKDMTLIIPQEEKQGHLKGMEMYLQTGIKKVLGKGRETKVQHKSGSTIPVLLTLSEAKLGEERIFTAFIKDYTEIVKQRNAAEQERLKNKAILDGCVDAVVTINAQNIVEYWNPAAEKLTGYSSEEMMGQNMELIIPERRRAAHNMGLQMYMKTGVKKVIGVGREEFIKTKDGKEIPILLTLSETSVGGHQIFTAFLKDISEQKAVKDAQDQLQRELEARMKQINLACIVSEADLKGRVTFVNDKLCEVTGYTREECIGKPHNMFRHPDTPKEVFAEMWDKIQNGQMFRGTIKNKKKNGDPYWVDAIIAPVLDDNGNPLKYVGVRYDITDIVLKEEALKTNLEQIASQEEELRQNMEEMTATQEEMARKDQEMSGILTAIDSEFASMEYKPDGTIIKANQNFCRILGFKEDELIEKKHSTFVDIDYANSNEYKSFWQDLGRGVSKQGDFQRFGKDGDELFIKAVYSPVFDVDGKVTKVVQLATDVTAFTKGFNEASNFINQLREGKFDAEMRLKGLNLPDNLKNVTDNLSYLRDLMQNILGEVNRVVKLAGEEGKLDEQLKLDNVSGAWGVLVNSINGLLSSITEPIFNINGILEKLAQGDLSQQVDLEVKGQLKLMADALSLAMKNIRDLILQVEQQGVDVAEAAVQLLAKSESMKNNTTEVASAIQEMAEGAQDQAAKTDESSKLVEGILSSAREMGKIAQTVNEKAESEQALCNSGLKTMSQLVSNMEEISKSAVITSESIDTLTVRQEEISRTLNVITDIAAQTNLLALNAAIEAARAGDAGRGFAVVAEEIRKLAEDSRRSAGDIEKVISGVQKDINEAAKAIEKMDGSVKSGGKATKEAETAFQSIQESSSETFSLSKDVVSATGLQEKDIASVVKNIEQIVVVSEETAAGTEEIAASSQALNSSMEEVSITSRRLTEIAENLKAGLAKFKLDK